MSLQVKMMNLTPHAITLHYRDGSILTIEPSGTVARCSEVRETVPSFGMDLARVTYSAIEGLPEYETPFAEYLVSGMVLAQCAGRKDVYAPDTGAGAVRDANGRIVGTTALLLPPRRAPRAPQVTKEKIEWLRSIR